MSEPQVFFAGGRRGRPRRACDRSTEHLHLRVTREERFQLERVAAENGETVPNIIRLAVNTLVADYSDREVFLSHKKGAKT